MIRAAIVGLGRWGRTLVSSIQDKSTDSALLPATAAPAPRPSRSAPSTASRYATISTQILADPAIDAVVFATPHSQHGEQVERAAAAGKHVFMEKPFTLDVKSAERALEAVARAGIMLGVAYPRRFHPVDDRAEDAHDDGRLGTRPIARARRPRRPVAYMPTAITGAPIRRRRPAGAMTATGVHNLDALIDLFGQIDEVYCPSLRR